MKQTDSSITEKPSTSTAYLQALFVFLWSSGTIAIVVALRYTNPFTFLFYRLLFATILMGIIVWITKAPWPATRNAWIKTLFIGLLMQFGYMAAYCCALYYGAPPTGMAIILGVQPLLTAVIMSGVLKQSVSSKQYVGLFLSLFGVFITVVHDFSTQSMTPLGFFFAILSLSAITIGAIMQKNNPGVDLRTGNTLQFGISTLPLLVIAYFFGDLAFPVTLDFILALSWMTLVVSVGATYLYYTLLHNGNAVKINSLFYLVPAVTAVLCYFAFDEPITAYTLAGILFIILGVFITQRT